MTRQAWGSALAGTVVLAAAWVLLVDDPHDQAGSIPAAVTRHGAADTRGRAALPDAPIEGLVTPASEATEPSGAVSGDDPGTAAAADGAATVEPAGPDAVLSGQVVDDEGLPVPHATVHGWADPIRDVDQFLPYIPPAHRVTADGAGRFELPALGPDFTLAAEAPGRAPWRRLFGRLSTANPVTGLQLTVAPAHALDVLVLGPGDRPLPDADLSARPDAAHTAAGAVTNIEGVFRSGPEPRYGRTDSDGRHRIEQLVHVPYEIEIIAAGQAPWRGRHTPGESQLVARLGAGLKLVGLVQDNAGQPLQGATVSLARTHSYGAAGLGRGDLGTGLAGTDERGLFVIDDLETFEDGYLAVHHTGHALHVEQPLVVRKQARNEVVITLQPGRVLAGHVLHSDGTPVAGAFVDIEGDRIIDLGGIVMSPAPTWERMARPTHLLGVDNRNTAFRGLAFAHCDEDGVFRLPDLYDGMFTVRAIDSDDNRLFAQVDAPSGSEDLQLVIDAQPDWGVTLFGRARDAISGRPVESFTFTPMIPRGNGSMTGISKAIDYDPDTGDWRVSGIDPGPMALTATAQGFAPWSLPPEEYAAGEYRLDIDFMPERTLHLRVVDTDRKPIEGANVTFSDREERQLNVMHGQYSRTNILRTDADGEVIAMGLPADRITVEIKNGWLGSRQHVGFDLRMAPVGVQEVVYGSGDQVSLAIAVIMRGNPVGGDTGQPAAIPGWEDGTVHVADLVQADVAADPDLAQAAEYFGSAAASFSALTRRIEAGDLRPCGCTVTVTVRGESGDVIAEVPLSRNDPRVLGPIVERDDPEGPWALKLLVPSEPITVELTSLQAGYEASPQTWRPSDNGLAGGLVVIEVRPRNS